MFTYFVQGPPFSPVKIGRATDVAQRVSSLQTATPHELRILRILEGDREAEMHERFSDDRIRGEWFRWSPAIESFVSEGLSGLPEVWHMVNAYCTNDQRETFNRWHSEAWLAADELRDWVRMMASIHDKDIPPQMDKLLDCISRISWLESD